MLSIAYMYEHGEGVGKDLYKAYEWYKKAEQSGEEGAEYFLSKKKFAKIKEENK